MRAEMNIPAAARACTPADIGVDFTDDAPAALRYAVGTYFAAFEQPIRTRHGEILCSCGAFVTNIMASFRWGLTHGEGFCGECGRPARGYHYVPDENKQECLTVRFVLFYLRVEVQASEASAPLRVER